MTYYFIGLMMIIRKVVLWFLLVISPFLAILAPFVFIRNIGWIWIGVFFQWVFYGPIFALFLGTMAKIWNSPPIHIPYIFDFSRVDIMREATYPTSINILYGGPAQTLGIWNTSNYVDTFAEYVIALVMLWTVLVLPWWLLRIFRDYCCEGIYGMKAVLTSMYDTSRPGGPHGPGPTLTPSPKTLTTSVSQSLSQQLRRDIETTIKLSTSEEIKKARTEDIVKSVSVKASNLADIARFETDKTQKESVVRNMEFLSNPLKAETTTERQRFMNVRQEIFNRATSGDQVAQATAAVVSTSAAEKQMVRQRIIQTIPTMVPVIRNISVKVNLPEEKTQSILQKIFNLMAYNSSIINNISQSTGISREKTVSVLQNLSVENTFTKPSNEMVSAVARDNQLEPVQVKQLIEQTAVVVKQQKELIKSVAGSEGVSEDAINQILDKQLPAVSSPEDHLDENLESSKKVSLEDYEQVKAMWIEQYEKGEVPLSFDIKDRYQWLEQDIIAITNIINKLLSTNPQLKNEALAEIGFILPIFMINNMSGEEILVYLRAKLEAAKQVKIELDKEKAMKKAMNKEEEFVEINKTTAKPTAKTQTMEESKKMNIPEPEKQKPTKSSDPEIEKIKEKLKQS